MGGHFTATATLMADFQAGDAVTTAPGGQISGSIHDFMQDDLELPFAVTFPAADISIEVTATDADFDGANAVWMISGDKSSSPGSWSGKFHNQGGDDVASTVTGEFAASYNVEVGRIEGAFGATRQTE